jgi:hypothetical protein
MCIKIASNYYVHKTPFQNQKKQDHEKKVHQGTAYRYARNGWHLFIL